MKYLFLFCIQLTFIFTFTLNSKRTPPSSSKDGQIKIKTGDTNEMKTILKILNQSPRNLNVPNLDSNSTEQDLYAYLFKIESNTGEDQPLQQKNVLYSKESNANGQLQYLDNEKLPPKVNNKILAKLFEILNKNFLDSLNRHNLVHKTHEFYDSFYNTCKYYNDYHYK